MPIRKCINRQFAIPLPGDAQTFSLASSGGAAQFTPSSQFGVLADERIYETMS